MGSVHIRQYLLSNMTIFKPVLVEPLKGFVTQSLMRPHLLVDSVPSEQGGFQPAQVGGQIFHLIKLLLISAEGALHLTIALWIVRPIEVVWQFEFFGRQPKCSQELAASV